MSEAVDIVRRSFELFSADKIAVVTRAVGQGRGSGAEVDWTFTTVWGLRDGLTHYHQGYTDRDEALLAIGPA